eukprot:14544-Heterococcus_DN1.PRE.1
MLVKTSSISCLQACRLLHRGLCPGCASLAAVTSTCATRAPPGVTPLVVVVFVSARGLCSSNQLIVTLNAANALHEDTQQLCQEMPTDAD